MVHEYKADSLNRIGSTRAATIATSIRLKEEWKSCRKRRPPFIPGYCPQDTTPVGGINPAGAVLGAVDLNADCSTETAGLNYIRTPNGQFTIFSLDGEALAINPMGLVTGYIFDNSGFHGFLRTLDGAIVPFDVPGSFGTLGNEISNTGAIIGVYLDANGVYHGFLRLP
jgi:hypothetical protein